MERAGLSEARVEAAARALGALLRPGDVVLLDGPMGAGKTTFTRALAEGLEVDRPGRVRSPTFNLCLLHPGPRPLAHVDLFRLAESEGPGPVPLSAAFEALGLDELADGALGDHSVLVVEWAQLWADPPPDRLRVELRLQPHEITERTLVAEACGERSAAVLEAWAAAVPA